MTRSAAGSLVPFFLLTYAASWALYIPVAATGGPTITWVQVSLITLGAYMPSLVALWLTWRAKGSRGVQRLIEPVFRWQVAGRWYLLTIGFVLAIELGAALVVRLTTGTWPRVGAEPLYLIPFAIALSTPFQAGEEIGWRGYALPRLTARLGPGGASVLLGVIWATWHLPLFFLRGADTYEQSFFVYLLQVTAISVAMAWLYARTGSLLLTMLMHAAINNTKDIFPAGLPSAPGVFSLTVAPLSWAGLALLWIAAVGFLSTMPRWPRFRT